MFISLTFVSPSNFTEQFRVWNLLISTFQSLSVGTQRQQEVELKAFIPSFEVAIDYICLQE